MKVDNLRMFVDFAWDFITDLPCSLDVLPDEWEVAENGENLVVSAAFEELEKAESVDVAPVVHAHWEESFNGKIRCCPICGTDFDATFHDIDTGWRYCPNCGAKMDEKEDTSHEES